MNPESLKLITELGVSGVALYMFYKIITRVLTQHSLDRKEDSTLWRDEIRDGRESTKAVLQELTTAITNSNKVEDVSTRLVAELKIQEK